MNYDNNTQKLFTKLTFLENYYEIDFTATPYSMWVDLLPKRKGWEPIEWSFMEPVTDSVLIQAEKLLNECIEGDR